MAMGQCKTGDNWDNKLTELQPEDFFNDYCTGRPYAKVVKLFFVTESFGDYKWQKEAMRGALFLTGRELWSSFLTKFQKGFCQGLEIGIKER